MEQIRKFQIFNKNFIRVAAAVLSLSMTGMLLSSCGGVGTGSGARLTAQSFAAVVDRAGEACGGHAASEQDLMFVSKSGLGELYFDPATFSVAVRDTAKNKLWTALPADGTHEDGSAAFRATVSANGAVYALNSQDNSVAFGAASHTIENGVLTVRYVMASDAAAAAKTAESVAQGELWLAFSVRFSLESGSLITELDCSSITAAPGVDVLELDVLGSFGASTAAQEGDFILVPDGSGALIRTDSGTPLAEPVCLRVYGSDPAINEAAENTALMGVFGVKQGDAAFCAIIEQGAAIARIRAEKSDGEGSRSRVWSSFILQDSSVAAGTLSAQDSVQVSGSRYTGSIRLCYRFLSDSNASYAGMAIASREQLIRDGVLPNISVEGDSLPFVFTTVGASDLNGKKTRQTTYSQAQDMVRQLKAKGVDNVYLRYLGALSGGMNQTDLSNASFPLSLGGKGDLEDLFTYMDRQNLRIFLDVNMLTASSRISGMSKAAGAQGKALRVTLRDPLASLIAGSSAETTALTARKIETALMDFLSWMKNYPGIEYSFRDVGQLLYSDFSGSGTDRETLAAHLSQLLGKASYDRELMVDTGNLYALKNADFITNLPLTCSYAEGEAYEAVPFIPMILHGTLDYSGEAINLSGDGQTTQSLLRSIEYGACPSYLWVYSTPEAYADSLSAVSYEKTANDAAKFYIQANSALADLRGSRMTDHQKISDGLYMTEYDSSSVFYVNYNDTAANVDGVSIPANGFIRIN